MKREVHRVSWRMFHVSVQNPGQKAKRRKQAMRESMPHLPLKKNTAIPTVQALTHFDQFYGSVFKSKWSSIRLGLLSTSKHAVIVNNFANPEDTCQMLQELGAINILDEFNKGYQKVAPYIPDDTAVPCDDEQTEDSEKSQQSSADEVDEDIEEVQQEEYKSIDPDEASKRIMKPDTNFLSENSSQLYQFMPTAKLKGMEEFVEESEYYDSYVKVDKHSVRSTPFTRFNFPKHLHCYTFARSDLSRFPSPRASSLSTYNYYCLDGASLLPVLALDVQPGHSVLDMCAAPGGKSLAVLQTLYPSTMVCNDVDYTRVKRLLNVLDQYLGKGDGIGDSRRNVSVTRRDGVEMCEYGSYDRVLVDAPCYSDRHSATSEEGNIFVKTEIKNRLKMPEKQSELLKNGLKHLAPGGSLVYSTCTLSPVQNDGVVHRVLSQLWEETSLNFEVADMELAVKPFKFMCKILGRREGIKYGQLVVPFLPNNFGPMYFCKINRV